MQQEWGNKSPETVESISLKDELSRYVSATNDESVKEWLARKEKQRKYCGRTHFLVYDRCSGSHDVKGPRCHRPDCRFCARKDMEKNLAKYASKINDFRDPVFLTLTIANSYDPSQSISTLYNGIGKLRKKRIGKHTLRQWEISMEEESERYSEELRNGKKNKYSQERIRRKGKKQRKAWYEFKSRCEQILNDKEIKNPRFYHLLKGLGKLHITYSVDKGFHSHFHCILDGLKIPQILMSRIWKDITGSYITDIRSGYDDCGRILIPYTLKVWELGNVPRELLGELLWALKGRKKLLTFNLGNKKSSIRVCKHCGRENCDEKTSTPVKSIEKLTHKKYMRMKKEGEVLVAYIPSHIPSQDSVDKFIIYWDRARRKLQWRRE